MFNRESELFNGCRVCVYDSKTNVVTFGIVFGYEDSEDTVDIIPDTSTHIITPMKFDVYKYDNWLEKKPVKVKSESDFFAKFGAVLKSSEETPMPPLYFTRKLPLKWDLTLMRASWIYCKFSLLPEAGYPTGSRMKTPSFYFIGRKETDTPGYIVEGEWNYVEQSISTNPTLNHTIRDVFCLMVHEVGHQYVQCVLRDFNTLHGGVFDEMMGKLATALKIQKKYLTVIMDVHNNQSAATSEDMTGAQAVDGKIKTSTGQDVDLKTPAKGKKFWVMVIEKDMRLFAVRQTDLLKAKEAVTYVNNVLPDGWKAALYDAPFAAFEFFNSQTGYSAKLMNSKKHMSGIFIQLIHEDGKLEAGRDIVAQYVRAVPDYMANDAETPE